MSEVTGVSEVTELSDRIGFGLATCPDDRTEAIEKSAETLKFKPGIGTVVATPLSSTFLFYEN